MRDWYAKLPGSIVAQLETEFLQRFLQDKQGKFLLQIGGVSLPHEATKRFQQRLCVLPTQENEWNCQQICAELDELPFAEKSIDAVILSHWLEYYSNPKTVLKEIYNVLAPGGQLFLFGFNPLSLWTLVKRRRRVQGFPWDGRFWSAAEVASWLRAVGFQIVSSKSICFRPPSQSESVCSRLFFLEALGSMIFINFGAVFVIVAQKRILQLTPQTEHWWQKNYSIGSNGMIEPTTRAFYDK